MTDPRIARIRAVAREVGADWALLTAPDAGAYAGHVAGIGAGPSPFDGGPTAVLVGEGILVACDELEAGLAPDGAGTFACEALGFSDLAPLPDEYAAALTRMLDRAGVRCPVAIQAASPPAVAAELIGGRGDARAFDGPSPAPARSSARPRSTPCSAAQATAAGQAAVPGAIADGTPELAARRETLRPRITCRYFDVPLRPMVEAAGCATSFEWATAPAPLFTDGRASCPARTPSSRPARS